MSIEAIRARFQASLVPVRKGLEVDGRLRKLNKPPQFFSAVLQAEIAYQAVIRAARPKPADGHDPADPNLADRVASLIGIKAETGTGLVSAGIRQKGKARLVEVTVNTGIPQRLYAPLKAVEQLLAQRAYASSEVNQLLSQIRAKGSA